MPRLDSDPLAGHHGFMTATTTRITTFPTGTTVHVERTRKNILTVRVAGSLYEQDVYMSSLLIP